MSREWYSSKSIILVGVGSHEHLQRECPEAVSCSNSVRLCDISFSSALKSTLKVDERKRHTDRRKIDIQEEKQGER